MFEKQGIPLLDDDKLALAHRHCQLNLLGVSDFLGRRLAIVQALPSVPTLGITLAFTPHPDVFPEIAVLRVVGVW